MSALPALISSDEGHSSSNEIRLVKPPEGPSVAATGLDRPTIDDEDGLSVAYTKNPRAVIRDLVNYILREGIDETGRVISIRRFKAIRFIFDRMIDATPIIRTLGANAILAFAEPGEVLSVALHEYGLYKYEGRLLTAAWLLSMYGDRSWPVLRSLAKSRLPECECFASVIAGLSEIPIRERREALLEMSSNPDQSTRERAMEMIEALEEQSA